MYKVKIDYNGNREELIIETELPKIPFEGDSIGFWHGQNWVIAKVLSIVFELDSNNKYLTAEINVTDVLD